jgi:hypothetical protein
LGQDDPNVPRGRRQFLKFLGAGLTGAAAAAQTAPPPPFAPIRPTTRDDLVLPGGYRYDVIARWGDRLPGTNAHFGYNADYTAFLPLRESGQGLLVVNHEYVSLPRPGGIGIYPQTLPIVMGRAPTIEDEMRDVGVSVLHVRRSSAGRWDVVASPLTRRYDANSRMAASGPALQHVGGLAGTLANCLGCHTPWRTVLTCEENYQNCVADDPPGFRRERATARATNEDRLKCNGLRYGRRQ